MDQQLTSVGNDVIANYPPQVPNTVNNSADNSLNPIESESSSTNEKSIVNNENINPVNSVCQPIKMDINQLLSQIMSITSQSLKDAQERFV